MGRVIIREGHRAEKFYLIIDGISKCAVIVRGHKKCSPIDNLADVYKLWENPITNAISSRLVAVLKKGSSFGVRNRSDVEE
jgi:hypothetical protein